MKYFYFLLLLAPVCAVSQPAKNTIMEIDSLFQTYFQPGEPGGAVLLVKDTTILYQKGFGIADIITRDPVTTKTLFNTGSISKTFVAYGILQMAQEGELYL